MSKVILWTTVEVGIEVDIETGSVERVAVMDEGLTDTQINEARGMDEAYEQEVPEEELMAAQRIATGTSFWPSWQMGW